MHRQLLFEWRVQAETGRLGLMLQVLNFEEDQKIRFGNEHVFARAVKRQTPFVKGPQRVGAEIDYGFTF
jgi:hypothetical protein